MSALTKHLPSRCEALGRILSDTPQPPLPTYPPPPPMPKKKREKKRTKDRIDGPAFESLWVATRGRQTEARK